MAAIPWMQAGPFGVMVHWTARTQPRQAPFDDNWDRVVDNFDVDCFADEVAGVGARWVIFTLGHAGRHFAAPNPVIEQYLPGWCSRRNLIGDLADALGKRDIRLLVYFQTEIDHEDEDFREAFAWDEDPADKSTFMRRWTAVLAAYARSFGTGVAGWWFDSCYDASAKPFLRTHDTGWDNSRFDLDEWFAAARAGNPAALVAMNCGANQFDWVTTRQDYIAGEANDLTRYPPGPLVAGMQWHALVWIDCPWGHFEQPGPIDPPRFTDAELTAWINECRSRGGGVTLNLGIYQDGALPDASLAQLARVRDRLD